MGTLSDFAKNVGAQKQANSSSNKAVTSGTSAQKTGKANTSDLAGAVRAAANAQKSTTTPTQTSAPATEPTAAGSSASSGTALMSFAKKIGATSNSAGTKQTATSYPRTKSIWSNQKLRQTVLSNMSKDYDGYDGTWESAKSFLPGMEKGINAQNSMISAWQDEAKQLGNSLTAQYKRIEQLASSPYIGSNPYITKQYLDAVDKYNRDLEEYKQYVSDIETAAGNYSTAFDKYQNATAVYNGGQKSLPKSQQIIDSILGADRTQVTGEKTDWGKLLWGNVVQGANSINAKLWQGVNMLRKPVEKLLGGFADEINALGTETINGIIGGLNSIPGVNIDYIKGDKSFMEWAYEDAQKGFQQSQEKYSANANSSRAAQIINSFGVSTVAAIPMALEAYFLKPYYAAKAAVGVGTKGLEYFSALQNSSGLQAASTMAKEGMRKLFSNPQFWTSYLQTIGEGYEDALKDGMSETDATIYGTVNGFFNALIEVGGADETLGGIQNFPMRLDQMKEEAGKKKLVEWFKDSVLGEAWEEVQQGAVERGMKAAATPDNGFQGWRQKWLSVDPTDKEAVFNPWTAIQEFTGGAVVGGLLGAGQTGISNIQNARYDAAVQRAQEELEKRKAETTKTPEADKPTQQQFYNFLMENGSEDFYARNKEYAFLLYQTDEGDSWIGQIYQLNKDGTPRQAVYETAEYTKETAAQKLAAQSANLELTQQSETTGKTTAQSEPAKPATESTLDSAPQPAVESGTAVPGLTLPSVEQETPTETKAKEGIEVAPGLRFIGSSPGIRLASHLTSGTVPQPITEGGTINGNPETDRSGGTAGPVPAGGTAAADQPAGDDLLYGDRGRIPGTGTGVKDRRLGEGTGRVQENRPANQAATASKRRANAQAAGGQVRLSSQELGVPQGTTQNNISVYPENLWDDELRAIDADTFSKTGQHTTFVLGAIERTASNGTVLSSRGLRFPDGREIIRVDHSRVTASQIHDHEDWHRMEAEDPGLHSAAITALRDALGLEQFNKIYDKYVTALWGTVSLPENPSGDDVEKACRDIEEEMLADMHGGINFARIGADRYKSIIDSVIESRAPASAVRAATASRTGPPADAAGRFSFDDRYTGNRREPGIPGRMSGGEYNGNQTGNADAYGTPQGQRRTETGSAGSDYRGDYGEYLSGRRSWGEISESERAAITDLFANYCSNHNTYELDQMRINASDSQLAKMLVEDMVVGDIVAEEMWTSLIPGLGDLMSAVDRIIAADNPRGLELPSVTDNNLPARYSTDEEETDLPVLQRTAYEPEWNEETFSGNLQNIAQDLLDYYQDYRPDYFRKLNQGGWSQRGLLLSQIAPLGNPVALRSLMNELRNAEGGEDIYYKLRDWQDYLRSFENKRNAVLTDPEPITPEQNGGIPDEIAQQYYDDVTDPRGGQGRAGDIFDQYVLRRTGSEITPFIYTSNYNHNSPIAKGIKKKDPFSIAIAAEEMQSFVPHDSVLIPMPGHNGRADDTLQLANAIAELYNQKHPEAPVQVLDALAGNQRASQYETKKTKHRSLTLEEMGMRTIADIPEDKLPVFIDNVVASGQTATAAQRAVGRGLTLAFAYGNRTTPVEGLKLANPVTYDDAGNPIPITERFDRENRDIRYSAEEEEGYPEGLSLPEPESESTVIDTSTANHTPEELRTIREYQAATDTDLVTFFGDILSESGDANNGDTFLLNPVSGRAAEDISRLTGVDATGYRTAIQGSDVRHIYNRHGRNGAGPQTLTDLNDVGRMQYILDNYDSAEKGKGTGAYRNRNNTASKTVVFSKAIDGKYYVVEAVPDSKARTAYIISAYIENKKTDTEHAADANAPTRTAETERTGMSVDNSIPNPERSVNRENTVELDSEGQELSAEQQEYFKDSKIRNEEGKLIPVYHGTDAEFTVFDRTKTRANMDIQGNFFSPWEIDAAGYGGNVGVYYLNIKNPASAGTGYAALNRFKGQNNAGVKAREYLESLGYDGVNNDDEEYIAFYPEQIKRIDNKAPTTNPDIRFSSDEQTEEERRREAEERERLAAAGAEPDVQPQTKAPKATPKESKPVLAKKNLRNQLITAFSVPEGRRAELGAIIDSYADRLYKRGEISQADRDALLDRLYSEGVMTVKHEENGLEENPRIYISPEIRAEFGDDWNNFRRRAFANGIYFTNNRSDRGADSWQQSLAGKYAGIYDDNMDMRTFLETLVQIAQDSKDEHMTLDEYNAYIANAEGVDAEMLHGEMMNNLERQLDNALRSFAEQADLEVYYRSREDRIRQEERRKAYEGRSAQQAKQAIKDAREKEHRQQLAQQNKENRELREMQQKTLKQLQWLSKNRYRMPDELAATAKEILSDLDVYAVGAARATNYSKRYEATWEDIAKIYKEARATDPNFFPSQDLERIIARLDNSKIADLDPAALADLYKAAIGLRTEFYNKQNVIDDIRHDLFQDVYDDTRDEMAKAPKGGKDNEIIKSLNLEMMTPANVMQMMFGWNKDSTGNRIAQQLTDGERNMKAFEVGAKALLDDFVEEHQDWIKKADGQGRDAIWYEIEVPELLELRMGDKPIFGKTVKVYMTPAQKVQLAIESKSKDNLRHMLGGRTFVDKDLYSKGKRAEAFAQGTTVKLAPETVESIVKDLTPEERELADILGNKYYNDYSGKKIDDVALKLYGYKKTMGGWYAPIFTNQNYTNNEAGLFDVTAEGVGNLKQRQVSKNPSYNISAFDAFEKNINMTKRFVGMAIPARNWQTLMNWQGEGTSFKDEMTHQWGNEYKEYIQNLITRLQAGGSQGLKEAKLEKATNKLLSNYITSVFGSNPGIVFKQMASFPQFAAVMGWDTMPSIGQLGKVDTDLMQTYTPELAYRMLGYSTPETATLKENPSKLDTNPVTKFVLRGGAISWMDGETVKRAWPWAENYVRKNFPDLEIGSEQDVSEGRSPFYKKVAEVFNEAVGVTQPMYDEMHRPNIMKDSRGVQRAFTMFKTVPLQQYNTLRKAAGEAAAAKEAYKRVQDNGSEERRREAKESYKEASGRMANAVTATIASVMMFNLIGFVDQLWKNRGKKYRDEDGNLTWNSVAKGLFSDSIDSITGMVVYGQELTDLITNLVTGEKWYGIEIPGGEQLDEIIDEISSAADTIRKVITDVADITAGGGDPSEYWRRHAGDFAGAIKDVAFTFSKYYNGLSAENIEKYIMGTLMTISPQTYTMLQDYFDTPAKWNLKGLTGEQFTQRAGDLFDSRNINVTDQQLRQLEQMYNDGYTDVIPTETAGSVSVNGNKYTLGANAQQIYDNTFAEYVNDGLTEILAGGMDERATSKAIETLYSYAAAKAKEAAAADQLTEADAKALKKSTATADEVMDHGVTLPEWSEWKGITSEKFPDEDEEGEERSANTVEKLQMLKDFDVDDEAKKALYGYIKGGYDMETEAGNPTNYAKMLDLTSRSMDIDEFIDWSVAYSEAEKETDKLQALKDFEASEDAKKDLFGYIKGGREMETETGNPTQYAKMIAGTNAGLTVDEYCTWLIDTADMKKDNEKLDYLADTNFTDKEKLALIGNLMGTDMKTASGNPTQYAKIKAMNDSGISIDDCIDLKLTDALDRYYNAQTKNKVASGDSNMTGMIINIEDELDKLKPANGDTQVDDFQKFEVIYKYSKQNHISDADMLDICRVYATYDSYIPKLELSIKHNVGIDTYCKARTAMRQASMANDNNITITTKEATKGLTKLVESGQITKQEAAVLYQLQQKNWSYKNNPFDKDIGKQVYTELNSGNTGSSGNSSGSGSSSGASTPSLDLSGLKLPSVGNGSAGTQSSSKPAQQQTQQAQQTQQNTGTQSRYPSGLSLPSPYGNSKASGSSGSTWTPQLPEQQTPLRGLSLPTLGN